MNRVKPVDSLQFNNDLVLYQQIQAMHPKPLAFVQNRDFQLVFYRQTASFQFKTKSFFVKRFQQPWPEFAMNFNRPADDLFR